MDHNTNSRKKAQEAHKAQLLALQWPRIAHSWQDFPALRFLRFLLWHSFGCGYAALGFLCLFAASPESQVSSKLGPGQ